MVSIEYYNYVGGAEAHAHYPVSSRAELMLQKWNECGWYLYQLQRSGDHLTRTSTLLRAH
jgi:hypothetical protein